MKGFDFSGEKPILTVMIQNESIEKAAMAAKNAMDAGADALGVQFCRFKPLCESVDDYRRVIEKMGDAPLYVTNYRYGNNEGKSDDELAEGMVKLAQAGAVLIDVMGDLFSVHPEQMTENRKAADKQKKLIDTLHRAGSQVLMSSHIGHFLPAERVLEVARMQVERGADVVKIVTYAENMEQQLENLRITHLLKKELRVPFLFLSNGECRLHRMIGPMLGAAMYLCVCKRDELAVAAQPLLSELKQVLENF